MKYKIYSPWVRTGGPEALHQLGDELSRRGHTATMCYVREDLHGLTVLSATTPLYAERYSLVGHSIADHRTNEWVIILP